MTAYGGSGSEPARSAPATEAAALKTLPHSLARTVIIRAPRALVFRYFTDSTRFAAWWGAGSSIDARPGGAVLIRYPNAVIARGTVESLVPDERVVFTYGYDDASKAIPAGASRVTIALADDSEGTRLDLLHEFAEPQTRDHHAPGWRYQLSLFANVVARELHADVTSTVDRFISAWNEGDPFVRHKLLGEIAHERIEFHDAYAAIRGAQDLDEHIAAVHTFMPGTTLERTSEPRHCQGSVLVDWAVRRKGEPAGRGTNYFELSAAGRIRRVVGFWFA